MESITLNVKDIQHADREALEHVLGKPLRENQRVIISVVNLQLASSPSDSSSGDRASTAVLPEWCDVYAGLTDDEIATLEPTVLTRADLSRPSD